MAVILETSLGDLTVDLYTDERPRCCLNFLKLCKMKYYNFCLFHSVQRNLVAQTGDPTGTGQGGESVFAKLYGEQAAFFEQELKPRIKHTKVGTLSMVNNGSNLHGSQFFITTGSNLDYLDNVHTVFGEVSEGFEVLEKMNEAIADEKHRPFQDIRMFHTVVLEDPYDDPQGLAEYIPDRSPEPTKEQLESGRIGVDEVINDKEGKSLEEIDEMHRSREAKANAQILEMVGDLPDAEVRPPDTVLFVCKLNPVTTDSDLEIIFSRFGTIKGCEVIRDKKTEESLQYAFIEFSTEEECENAYFKMDNVIIDDHRIHVDFSQSVSKYKWKGKGKGVETKEDRPSYIIKDKSRRDDGYNLVFSDDDNGETAKGADSKKKHKKKKKKHKKHKHNRDDESSDSDRSPSKHKRKEIARQGSPLPKYRTDTRRDRSRSPGEDRQRQDKDKDRRRDRDDADRDRSKYYSKDRDRERDRGRDRDRRRDT